MDITLADVLIKLIPVVVVFMGLLNTVPLLVFLERKICAWIQDRVGPNRVGILGPDSPLEILGLETGHMRILGGFMQPLADAVKLFTKEIFVPAGADKTLFLLGPLMALLPPMLAWAVIPVAPDITLFGYTVKMQIADLNVGILFILAVASFSPYGLAFGGWASNNKYALLGGVRAMAQIISYEVGMGIVLLSMIMYYDTVSLREMTIQQAQGFFHWGIFHQPLAFILFTVCAFAENNRLPFDLAECEAELVGGFHTEYNSMGFGMFFQGEYIAMLGMGALIAVMFLGGWHYPGYGLLHVHLPHLLNSITPTGIGSIGIDDLTHLIAAVIGLHVFAAKTFGFVAFSMWIRWTLPRFRWDQLMHIGWSVIIPLALANLLLTAFLGMK
jgi:NADH-quinone oxidoreductase subunit H